MRLSRRRSTVIGVGIGIVAIATAAAYAAAGGVGSSPAHTVGLAGTVPSPATTASSSPSIVPSATATLHNAPAVAPLGARISPDVLVVASRPFTAAQVAAITKAAGKTTHALVVDAANVRLGGGTTMALGVDPSTFRAWTPAGTAESDQLWQSVARGDVAVAHAVGKALAVPLGGTTTVGAGSVTTERVGAYATTGLPGVGVVIDSADDAPLHLQHGAAILLTVANQDPVLTAAILTKDLGKTASATAVRVPVTNGHLQWVAPAYGPITSPFGPRNDPNHPGQTEIHEGIDIGAPLGAPIYAAAAGTVEYAGPASGYGNEVILDNGEGIETIYGHMEQILVTSGPVTAGQPIAIVGAEGDATGPHLHFEVHVNDTPVDPAAWLVAHGVKIDS